MRASPTGWLSVLSMMIAGMGIVGAIAVWRAAVLGVVMTAIADVDGSGHTVNGDLTCAVTIAVAAFGGGELGGAAVADSVHINLVAAVGGQGDVQIGRSTVQLDGTGDVGEDGGDVGGCAVTGQRIQRTGVVQITGSTVQFQISDGAVCFT